MKKIGTINPPKLAGGLVLGACVVLSGLFMLQPDDVRSGEVSAIDHKARRIVIREIEVGKTPPGGLVVSSAVGVGLNIDALKHGDRIRFVLSKRDNEWMVVRIEAQP